MSTNYAERIWEERKKNLPNNLVLEGLEQNLVEWAKKHQENEALFCIEHLSHGTVVLKHVEISAEEIQLSSHHNSWERIQNSSWNNVIKYEYFLICKTCHASFGVVDENTPKEFRAI